MSDENTVVIPDDGSPPGHIEKMLGRKPKADDQNEQESGSETVVIGSRPENVPEKFWDAEKGAVNTDALLKAQQDAEAALRKAQQGGNEGNEDESEGDETPTETSTQAGAIEAADKEWQEKGELSEDTFKTLEQAGISREMVQLYVAGQQAIVGNLQKAAYGPFDGKDGYDKAANWAAENLSDAEIKALDVQITSTNPDVVAQGAKALYERFKRDGSHEPTLQRGGGNGGNVGSGTTYNNRAEMVADMSDPRYRTNPAFRKEVEEKLRRSKLGRA